MQRGCRPIGIYIGAGITQEIGDVDGAAGVKDRDAERMTPGDERQADGVIAGVEDDGESAVDGVNGARRSGAEAGRIDEDFVRRGEQEFCVHGLDEDVGQISSHGCCC